MAGTLDNSPAEVVAALLEQLAVAGVPTPVMVGNEPDSPDTVVTVYDTTNVLQGRQMYNGVVWEQHGVQVRIRAPKQKTAAALANRIAIALDQQAYDEQVSVTEAIGTATATYVVHALSRKSGPIPLGKEEPTSRRSVFTINYTVGLRQTA